MQVNLLPAEYRPPKPLRSRHYLLLGSVFLVLFGLTTYYRGVATSREELLAAGRVLQAELTTVEAQLQEVERLTEREARVAEAEVELKGMEGRRWSPLLLRMAGRTAPGLAWERLTGDGRQVDVFGVSSGLEPLARFVTGLSMEPFVERVQLHEYVEQAESDSHSYAMTILLQEEEGPVAAQRE